MDANGIIIPEDENEPEVKVTTGLGLEKEWAFSHVETKETLTAFGELVIYSNCLAVIKDGEFVLVVPSYWYTAEVP